MLNLVKIKTDKTESLEIENNFRVKQVSVFEGIRVWLSFQHRDYEMFPFKKGITFHRFY